MKLSLWGHQPTCFYLGPALLNSCDLLSRSEILKAEPFKGTKNSKCCASHTSSRISSAFRPRQPGASALAEIGGLFRERASELARTSQPCSGVYLKLGESQPMGSWPLKFHEKSSLWLPSKRKANTNPTNGFCMVLLCFFNWIFLLPGDRTGTEVSLI